MAFEADAGKRLNGQPVLMAWTFSRVRGCWRGIGDWARGKIRQFSIHFEILIFYTDIWISLTEYQARLQNGRSFYVHGAGWASHHSEAH